MRREGRSPSGVLSIFPLCCDARVMLPARPPHPVPLGHEGVRVPTVPSGHVSSPAPVGRARTGWQGPQREGTDWTRARLQLWPRVPTGQKGPD